MKNFYRDLGKYETKIINHEKKKNDIINNERK